MKYSRIVEWGENLEVSEYEIIPEYHGSTKKKKRKRRARRSDRKELYRRPDNIRRLAKGFVRLVGANLNPVDPPALATLTMLEVVGIAEAYRAFTVFITILRTCSEANFRYFCVPEFQKRGAVHFHVLMWGLKKEFYDDQSKGEATTQDDLRESINRRIQNIWQRGFADCISTNGSPHLGGYLAKYMSKAMHDKRLLGKKAYTASRNVLRPVLSKVKEEFDDVSDYYLRGYNPKPKYEKEFETQWLGKGRYRLFKKL